jgi:RimJ/RimL family protein N-acetyltransferase
VNSGFQFGLRVESCQDWQVINWPVSHPTLIDGDLLLRVWSAEDTDFVFTTCQESAIQEFTTVPVPYSLENAKEFIRSRVDGITKEDSLDFVGCISGVPVLSVSLHHVNKFDHAVEIGYWVASDFRGSGLGARAAKLISDFAFAIGFRRVEALTDPENFGSQKTLTSAGFEFENILRQKLTRRDGTQIDALVYSKFPPVDPKNFK